MLDKNDKNVKKKYISIQYGHLTTLLGLKCAPSGLLTNLLGQLSAPIKLILFSIYII